MRARTSWRRALMRGAQALTASAATFATSWWDFNCTIRAGDHRNRRAINIKTIEIRIKAFLEFILPTTMASNLASHTRTALASSSAA